MATQLAVRIEIETLMQDKTNHSEFLAWATSDQEFLESFVELIATGWSKEESHPYNLDRLREKVHAAIGDEYLEGLAARIQEAERERNNANAAERRALQRLDRIKKLLPQVFVPAEGHDLKHDKGSDRDYCPACQFLDAIREEAVP